MTETIYECGNYGAAEACPYCDAEPREGETDGTVAVTCPGWGQ